MKRKPTGFLAICQCSTIVGAVDYVRTDKDQSREILLQWLNDGCTVKPIFQGDWQVSVRPCRCNDSGGESPSNGCYPVVDDL